MAASLNGGSTLGWVRGVLGASWQELYDCAALVPGEDAPLFLPHLHGERTPYLDPGMRGAWTGLAPQHRREELLYAALEGVAFTIREAADCLLGSGSGAGSDPPQLRLAGGGTTAPGWRQMLADILERPVTPVDVPGASALGAALLAREAAGIPGPDSGPQPRTAQPATRPRPGRSLFHRRAVRALSGMRRGPAARRARAPPPVRAAGRRRPRAMRQHPGPLGPSTPQPLPTVDVRHGTTGATMRRAIPPPVRRPRSAGHVSAEVTFS